MIITCPNCSSSFNVPDGAITAEGRKVKCSSCSNLWIALPDEPVKSVEEAIQSVSVDIKSHLDDLSQIITSSDDKIPPKPVGNETVPAHPSPEIASDISKSQEEDSLELKASQLDVEGPDLTHLNPEEKGIFESNITWGLTIAVLFMSFFFFTFYILVEEQGKLHNKNIFKTFYRALGIYNNDDIHFETIESKVITQKGDEVVDDTLNIHIKTSLRNTGTMRQVLATIRFTFYDVHMAYINDHLENINRPINAGELTVFEGTLNSVPFNAAYVGIDFGGPFDIYFRKLNKLT